MTSQARRIVLNHVRPLQAILSQVGANRWILESRHLSYSVNKVSRTRSSIMTSMFCLKYGEGTVTVPGPRNVHPVVLSYGSRLFATDANVNNEVDSAKKRKSAKPEKSKEFKIKSSIGAHDLTIKMNQMKGLLEKGKSVTIILRSSRDSQTFKSDTSKLFGHVTTELQNICKVRQEFSNETAAKFVLTPLPKEDS